MRLKKLTVIGIIITVCTVLTGILLGERNLLVSGVRETFAPVLTFTSGITRKANDISVCFLEAEQYKKENAALKKEISRLNSLVRPAAEYKEEIDRLKSLLGVRYEMEDSFDTVAAEVVSYGRNNWYDTIVLNKGKGSGISVGDAVISDMGAVGKVIEAGVEYSVVSTVLSRENSMAVRIVRNSVLAVAEGDTALAADKLCKMSFIEKRDDVKLGDYVETTGAGGVYPAGVSLGTIKEFRASGSDEYAVIQPSVDLSELTEVLVICRELSDFAEG